ncbi:murein hydrolase activator EnvC family protein [Candidatus Nitrotoga sp. 1052]|uniref:murein hydrolase activator EnvC family protein n=1 Tax=Candidatus Nitrotoga sp. 1052 TaxID=2886964 RepID=UPI001EF62A98|nr:peptidoglycan DD-metalloendopeptidase family protein [Candidatus Nitrotoga sp. 1052]CAH1081814.1 Septal ring factor EnvC, activator of murein hydrolases AmiA and AmiB [Candidatus Nitrotoga sp. 1052]
MTSLTRHALLLCICLVVGINSTQAAQQEELDNLRKHISVLQKELEKTSESQSEATDELRESERAISNSKRKLAELSLQHRAADHTLGKLRQQAQQLERDIQSQQAMLSKLLYQQYLGGKQEYFKLLLNNHDPDQAAREMRYYEYIARGRSTWLNMLRVNLAQLNEVVQQTQQKSGEIAALQEEENAQQKILEKDKLARQQVISQFAQQLKQQRHEIGRLQRDENRLSQLVAKLSKILTRQKGKGVFNNDKLPDNRFDGKPFEQLKGKLTLPVMGEVVNKFGSARPDSTVLWRGLLLRAASGQPVKSVAAGRVVFADWLRGFGNLLIIDHGKGYMSLYGNNETLYKQVGDVLRGGDTVAAVGNSGGNEDSGVYFELRHRGEPLDPIKWIAR